MDKTTSFRCIKYALVAGNATVIVLGVTGFILGLIDPPFIQVYDPEFQDSILYPVDYGPQLALVSCIAVVIGTAGLIGALREHFYLLLVYALCILLVFIFRLLWWATSTLHQEKRFILDLTVSLTLLTFLGSLFLFILAILEMLTIQNSLPLTKKKFQMLKSKLQQARQPQSKSKSQVDSSKGFPPKAKPRSSKSSKPSPADNIYITSSSIYGSGRRRSPVRMNGHGHGHDSNRNSSRARKYLPGVGYSSHSPQNSDSSHDSNNNKNTSALTQNVSLNTKASDSPLVIDTVEQHRVPKNLSSDHYYRFQSPSPSTPTGVKETYPKTAAGHANQQPFFLSSQFDHPHRTSSVLSPTTTEPKSSLFSPQLSGVTVERSRLTSTPTQRAQYSQYSSASTLPTPSRPILTSNATSSYSTSYSRTTSAEPITSSSYSGRPSTLFSPNKWSTPTTTITAISSSYTPATTTTSTLGRSRDLKTERANFFTSPPTTYSSSGLFQTSLRGTSTATPPTYKTTTPTTTSSNLNQTRNLFSMYTSPLSTTSVAASSSYSSSYSVSKPSTTITSSSITSPYSAYSRYTPITTRPSIISPSPSPRGLTKTPLSASSSSPFSQSVPYSSSSNYLGLRSTTSTNTRATPSANTTTSAYRSLLSSSSPSVSAVPTTTTSSSTSTLFSRLYPKSYEDYVKSYRYPTSTAQSDLTSSRRSGTNYSRPTYTTASTLPLRATSPQPQRTTSTDRTMESYSSMTRSESMGNDLEKTTTYMSTTTQHRQLTERESVYYRHIVREG